MRWACGLGRSPHICAVPPRHWEALGLEEERAEEGGWGAERRKGDTGLEGERAGQTESSMEADTPACVRDAASGTLL